MKPIDSKTAREKVGEARRLIDSKRSEQRNILKNRMSRLSKSIKKSLTDEVFSEIERRASGGYGECDFSLRSYGSEEDCAKVLAYRGLMSDLGKRMGYRVKEETEDGYNGDGFNMSDFYTRHTWTVFWGDDG